MRFVTCEQMRALERRAILDLALPGALLMGRAGYATARAAWLMLGDVANGRRTVTVLAGGGNNGGDGFGAARHLTVWGAKVRVLVAGERAGISGDALTHLERMTAVGLRPEFLPDPEDWVELGRQPCDADLVVDALLGTGAAGAPRGAVASAIRVAAGMAEHALVLAVDVPSGLDADTGAAQGEAVQADLTVTFGRPKTGMARPEAWAFTGSVLVEDIGISGELGSDLESWPEMVCPLDFRDAFPARKRCAHKGDFGRVCVIAGAAGFAGAAAMAARAAARAGAGLVFVLAPRSVAPTIAALVPEAMVHGIDETPDKTPAFHGVESRLGLVADSDAVLVGPGMTPHEETRMIVDRLLGLLKDKPLVVDADGLNVHAGQLEAFAKSGARVFLTPHPGELARLTGKSVGAIQGDRPRAARDAADCGRCIVVLKGAGTLVASPLRVPRLNLTGNPGMATGGSGDVLAGLLAGLSAQTADMQAAAEMAVWCHGHAGDRLAWKGSQAGLIAPDLLEIMPEILRGVMSR